MSGIGGGIFQPKISANEIESYFLNLQQLCYKTKQTLKLSTNGAISNPFTEESLLSLKNKEMVSDIAAQCGWTHIWYQLKSESKFPEMKEEEGDIETMPELVPNMKLLKKLGSGAFGDVFLGLWENSDGIQERVAVKMLQVNPKN